MRQSKIEEIGEGYIYILILSWNISIVTSTIENVSIDTCITENRAKSVLRFYAEGFNVKQAIPTIFLKNKKTVLHLYFLT